MAAPGLDARRFRDALGHYASGLTVISGISEGEPVGFTCQSFYSVSLEPPLVSFCVSNGSRSWPLLRRSGAFSINVLASDHEAVANAFARSSGDRWAGIEWSPSAAGNPLIDSALMWFDCTLYAEHIAGDHTIVIGEVQTISEPKTMAPLLYFKGNYRLLSGA